VFHFVFVIALVLFIRYQKPSDLETTKKDTVTVVEVEKKDTGVVAKKIDDVQPGNKKSTATVININVDSLLNFAKSLIGTPYVYASSDPAVGFDCSGFITYVFNHFNIEVPRSSKDFRDEGIPIALAESKPGDLILFTGTDSTERVIGHMGIIVKNNNEGTFFIHSTSGKAHSVVITKLNDYYMGRFVKVIRILV
jgi:cell wall-associated NlpC family hydrolase